MDILFSHVYKAFGEKEVFRDYSAALPAGKLTCLIAPSGAGKTTLLRMCMGLETPDKGTVSGLPSRCSAVFQTNRLIPQLTALQNVCAVLPRGSERAAKELLARLGLGDTLHRKAQALSGGMARRTALARALLADGELLLLDEPFSSLDEEAKQGCMDAILELWGGKTVLMASHSAADGTDMGGELLYLPVLHAGEQMPPEQNG